MRLRFFFTLFLAVALPRLLCAQSVRWDPPTAALPVGQAQGLGLVFEGCAPRGQPNLPKVDGLTLQFYGQSQNTSIVNLTVTQTVVLTYAALLTKNDRVEIPAFEVDTDKGRMRVQAARYEATGATVGKSGTPLEAAANAKFTAKPGSVWAGQVFDLNATILAARRYAPQIPPNFDWNADPLAVENWSKPDPLDLVVGGEPHVGFSYNARAVARTPGTIKLNPTTHLVGLSVGVSGFGFFQQRQYDQYSVASNAPTLEVKPLPPQPAGFSGAVGDFKLTSKLVPANAAVGEPVTWTIELSGTGNWPDVAGLPSRDVSKDFNVVQPQAKRTAAEGKLFDVTLAEDVVLVPTKPGTYNLGPINFVCFDPKTGTYKTITTPRHALTVTPPEAPKFTFTPPPGEPAVPEGQPATKSGAASSPPAPSAPPVATLPSGIPRDPLSGAKVARSPLEFRELMIGVSLPFAAVLLVWAGLALRRAQRTDPVLPRRLARARLAATLAKLSTAPAAQRPALLLQWQRDAAALWQISHAAPPASAFRLSREGALSASSTSPKAPDEGKPSRGAPSTGTAPEDWPTLWQESDRALYGNESPLPTDWIARAQKALATKPVPGFSPFQLFRSRNLAPFLAALALVVLITPLALSAQEPATAYRAGDFAAAEKTWRETSVKTPTDSIARHNLSLALAQQDRWTEAAAHSAAAFVQNPIDPAVRWQFALSADKAGAVPAPLDAFLRPGLRSEIAGRASPADWQRLIIVLAGGVALALIAMLFNAYGRRSIVVFRLALAIVALCSASALVATAAVLAYGNAASTQAVITVRSSTLRSIPTEADTAQKTSPLNAGTLATVEKTFLGWVNLAFDNGQTGWVRKEEVTPVWTDIASMRFRPLTVPPVAAPPK